MSKTILEQIIDHKSKPRCETCNGSFGLIRHRYRQKQFCSKQCLERYQIELTGDPSSFKQWLDFDAKRKKPGG